MSERQEKGEVLERLTYDVLKQLLLSRLGTTHQEQTRNGFLCTARNYELFWNKQVMKEGKYPKMVRINGELTKLIGKRKRLPDIVLCHKKGGHTFPDPSAILAIELKNTNLNFQWTKAALFDRDVMERFLWTPNVFQTLKMDNDGWEKYAEHENLFPNAVKVLIIPKFAFYPKATEVRPWGGAEKLFRDIAGKLNQSLGDEVALENSEKGWIEWRIKRLKLEIQELDYQPLPRVAVPDVVKDRMHGILVNYLDRLGVGP
jgi:hypothetical protein